MIEAGEIYLADLNEKQRRLVLVISTSSFHQRSARALVAPQLLGAPEHVLLPWRVQVDGVEYGVDLMRSITVDRLLERVDRAPASVHNAVRRAVRSIT